MPKLRKKQFYRFEWDKTNVSLFQSVCNDILDKIKVPFQSWEDHPSLLMSEKQVLLNIYTSELIHTMLWAKKGLFYSKRSALDLKTLIDPKTLS